MLPFKEIIHVDQLPKNIECIVGADIGGTNSNFGIFRLINGELKLLLSIHIKSKEITDFSTVVRDVLDYLKKQYAITIKKSSFAAAGVVSETKDFAKPTNLNIAIDAKEMLKKTGMDCAFVVNDFEIIGYGLDNINPNDLVQVNPNSKTRALANKAILGAGTGLGKCILIWNKDRGRYVSSASEGGHADFAAQTKLELDLITFIRQQEERTCNISWEDVLSGDGIQRIHRFFKSKNGGEEGDKEPHPDEIFNSRNRNKNCRETFELYTTFYARCAKNFALDALALSGVYIAGGIAAKNLPMFELPAFMSEFTNCGKQQELLKQVPIWVITDYNVSLYGAATYMLVECMCD